MKIAFNIQENIWISINLQHEKKQPVLGNILFILLCLSELLSTCYGINMSTLFIHVYVHIYDVFTLIFQRSLLFYPSLLFPPTLLPNLTFLIV